MTTGIPADVVALCDYERHAAARMPAPLRAYLDGAGAEIALERRIAVRQQPVAH